MFLLYESGMGRLTFTFRRLETVCYEEFKPTACGARAISDFQTLIFLNTIRVSVTKEDLVALSASRMLITKTDGHNWYFTAMGEVL